MLTRMATNLGVSAHTREQFARQPIIESQTLIGRASSGGKQAGRINAHVRRVTTLGREFVGARGTSGGQCPDLRENEMGVNARGTRKEKSGAVEQE